MLFSSTTFLYFFLPAVILGYYIFKKSRKIQNVFLLLSSLLFYAWGEPKFVLVMLLSIITNWLIGIGIGKTKSKSNWNEILLATAIVFNLSILFVFKYLTFTGNLIRSMLSASFFVPVIGLPIGISFFTFQALSYVIDVYRQKTEVQRNILYVGLYISFFPQLIAGPIVRYETIAEEIMYRKETLQDFSEGFRRFVVGLSKKVLLANSLAILADYVFKTVQEGSPISVALGWLGAIAYALQIFFDFSGYSDMAIGLGRMFGFHFPENFNYPYIAKTISEFWRRWHISLSSWFRDYVYIPLGGNRVSKARNILNLFIVWFLTGLWHGANFTFIIWGLMFFVLITIEKLTGLENKNHSLLNVIKRVFTLMFLLIGWVIFRAGSLPESWNYLKTMFGVQGTPFVDRMFLGYFLQNLPVLMIGIVLSTPSFKLINEKLAHYKWFGILRGAGVILLFILSTASIVSNSYNPFIYFNF